MWRKVKRLEHLGSAEGFTFGAWTMQPYPLSGWGRCWTLDLGEPQQQYASVCPHPSTSYFLMRALSQMAGKSYKLFNPFARNEARSSKTEVKVRVQVVPRNPFARNEGRSPKTAVKLRFPGSRCNPFARNEGRSPKTEVKLRFLGSRCNPFARNEGRSRKTEVKLRFFLCVQRESFCV